MPLNAHVLAAVLAPAYPHTCLAVAAVFEQGAQTTVRLFAPGGNLHFLNHHYHAGTHRAMVLVFRLDCTRLGMPLNGHVLAAVFAPASPAS